MKAVSFKHAEDHPDYNLPDFVRRVTLLSLLCANPLSSFLTSVLLLPGRGSSAGRDGARCVCLHVCWLLLRRDADVSLLSFVCVLSLVCRVSVSCVFWEEQARATAWRRRMITRTGSGTCRSLITCHSTDHVTQCRTCLTNRTSWHARLHKAR